MKSAYIVCIILLILLAFWNSPINFPEVEVINGSAHLDGSRVIMATSIYLHHGETSYNALLEDGRMYGFAIAKVGTGYCGSSVLQTNPEAFKMFKEKIEDENFVHLASENITTTDHTKGYWIVDTGNTVYDGYEVSKLGNYHTLYSGTEPTVLMPYEDCKIKESPLRKVIEILQSKKSA